MGDGTNLSSALKLEVAVEFTGNMGRPTVAYRASAAVHSPEVNAPVKSRIDAVALIAIPAISAPGATLIFYRSILPIPPEYCQICHSEPETGPMVFLHDYRKLRPWAKAIRLSVVTKRMSSRLAGPGNEILTLDTPCGPGRIRDGSDPLLRMHYKSSGEQVVGQIRQGSFDPLAGVRHNERSWSAGRPAAQR